jgi:hypothetical protein
VQHVFVGAVEDVEDQSVLVRRQQGCGYAGLDTGGHQELAEISECTDARPRKPGQQSVRSRG